MGGPGSGKGPRPNFKSKPGSRGAVTLYNGQGWYLHPNARQNLDILLNDVQKSSMDLVIVIDGPEGLGKSFMARGLAMYCATFLKSTFGVEDIHFTTQDYVGNSVRAGRAKDTGKHKINVLDEGRHALNRSRGGSRGNVYFTNYLSECRDMGQIHIILAPAFHDLDKYLILWRMALLVHCTKNYKEDPESPTGVTLQRGEYKIFINNAGGKKALNTCYEMKSYTYPHVWEVHGFFSSREVFTPEQIQAYEKKKYGATLQKYAKDEEQREKEKKEDEEVKKSAQEYVRSSMFAKKLGLAPQTVINSIKAKRLKGRQFGRLWYVHTSELENQENKPLDPSHTEMRRECARKARENNPFNNKEVGA